MASIFSRIASGEIPAAKLYEDDQTIAFLDIRPAAQGHTLVICKDEFPTLLDVPPDLLCAVTKTTQHVMKAIKKALQPDGFNVVQNNGSAAGQVVFHYHVHIIPRWEGDKKIMHWIQEKPEQHELEDVASKIRQQIAS
jgi:histidine triad (HIT) family protein